MRIEDLKGLAKIISLAQDIREKSFVPPDSMAPQCHGHYMCNMYKAGLEAAAQVTNLPLEHVIVEGIAQLVYLLNSELWYDMQGWNADILKLPEVPSSVELVLDVKDIPEGTTHVSVDTVKVNYCPVKNTLNVRPASWPYAKVDGSRLYMYMRDKWYMTFDDYMKPHQLGKDAFDAKYIPVQNLTKGETK